MKDIKAVFDIGNDSIKTVVFAKDHEESVVLFKHIQESKGIRKGKFMDLDAFTENISKILEKIAQKLGGDFIDEVFVGVSHPQAKVKRISEQKRIMTDEITRADIDHLSKVITDVAVDDNYEIIKVIPVSRLIDGDNREKDPIGLKGKRLELIADVFMIPKGMFNSLQEAFDNVGLSIVDFIPNIVAASEVILDYDRKDLGTVLIDIGKNQTSYSVFEDGYCLGYGVIPIGGEDVTKDISIGMQIDIKEADQIKKHEGYAFLDKLAKSKDQTLDVHFLTDVIGARYEEIFEKINQYLVELGKDGRLPGGVLLIGGGSKMQNVDLLAKSIFKLATFHGKPHVDNIGDIGHNIQFVNVLGCYAWSNKYVEGRKGSALKLNFNISKGISKFFKDLF